MNSENTLPDIFKDRKKLPVYVKNRIYTFLFFNFIFEILMSIIVLIVNIAYHKLSLNNFQNYIKCVQMLMAIITIITFEKSYRKDSGKIAIHGIEFFIFSIAIMFVQYMYIANKNFNFLRIVVVVFLIYYIIKSAITVLMIRHNYIKENVSDVKEIINEDKKIDKIYSDEIEGEKGEYDKDYKDENKEKYKEHEEYEEVYKDEKDEEQKQKIEDKIKEVKPVEKLPKKKKTIRFSGGK